MKATLIVISNAGHKHYSSEIIRELNKRWKGLDNFESCMDSLCLDVAGILECKYTRINKNELTFDFTY